MEERERWRKDEMTIRLGVFWGRERESESERERERARERASGKFSTPRQTTLETGFSKPVSTNTFIGESL